jgi:transposase
MEKVWAYMKINDLLKNTAITDDVETKAILKKRTHAHLIFLLLLFLNPENTVGNLSASAT